MKGLDASYDGWTWVPSRLFQVATSVMLAAGRRCGSRCDTASAATAAPGPPSGGREIYRKFPIVNSNTSGSSLGWASSGIPHSKRSGPIGENHRKPKPTDLRRPEVSDSSGRKHGSNLIETTEFLRCSPEQ